MPYYEYHCSANGRTVEVRHGMSEHLETWGELCERAAVEPGDTPAGAPVSRLMSAPAAVGGGAPDATPPSCGPGCACATGA